MSQTKEQASVMIGYLFQAMFERGEMLRKMAGSKEAIHNADIIHSLARSISILREDYGLYDRAPQPDDAQPEQPQAEPAEYDQERTEDAEPEEEPQPV